MAETGSFSLCSAIVAMLASTVFFSTGCAAAKAQTPPLHPCIEARTKKPPPLCDAGMTETECRETTAFVRAQIERTVVVWVANYDEEKGAAYGGGTGTIISDTGLVLTAEHVVTGALFVTVGTRRLSDNGKDIVRLRDIPMRVLAKSKEKDVALLAPMFKENFPPPMPLYQGKGKRIAEGTRLWQFGNTSYWKSGPFLFAGASSGPLTGLLKVDIVSDGGDSGGPLVTENGEIAGVLVRDDKFGTSPTYFVPIDVAIAELMNDK